MTPTPTPVPPPSPGPARPLSPPAALARIGLGLLAFFATGVLLRAVASPGGGPLVGAKRQLWARRGGEFDTVFLGSSHVYRGIVPAEFDRVVARAGRECRSFNFGVQLPNLIECRFLLREILARGPRLERVFLELQALVPQIDPPNAYQPRAVYWHDPPSTALAVERAIHWGRRLGPEFRYVEGRPDDPSLFAVLARCFPDSWRVAGEHVTHGLVEGLFVGRTKDLGRGLLGRMHGQAYRLAPTGGYLSLEQEDQWLSERGQVDNPYSRRAEHFRAHRAEYLALVRELAAAERAFGDQEWMNAELLRVHDLELLRGLVEDAHRAGVELILVAMPQGSVDRPFEDTLAEALGVAVFLYDRPEFYPELYDPELRFDSGHLSEKGARTFTRRLAEDWLECEGGAVE